MECGESACEEPGPSRLEVLEKVGRNLLLFQQAERRLKWLAARRRISGMGNEIEIAAKKLSDQVSKETLGAVVLRATNTAEPTDRDREKAEAAVLRTGSCHVEIDFCFSGVDGEPDVEWQEKLAALVDDRNDLVHHFLERFDLGTPEGRRHSCAYLDQQHARQGPVVEDLKKRCESVIEDFQMLAAALKQPDIRAEFLFGHLKPRLEELLHGVAAKNAREDGWTYLSLAGDELANAEPGMLKRLEEAFEYCGLKQAVAAMEAWELHEEPTKNGVRVLYRPIEQACPTKS